MFLRSDFQKDQLKTLEIVKGQKCFIRFTMRIAYATAVHCYSAIRNIKSTLQVAVQKWFTFCTATCRANLMLNSTVRSDWRRKRHVQCTPISCEIAFCSASGYHCVPKTCIPNIFDCNLKKNYQILIILVQIFLRQLATKWSFSFFTLPYVCSCTTCGKLKQRNIRGLHLHPMRYNYLIKITNNQTL